jgi:transcriptional regulator with XRE-family HTH domain
MTIAERVDAAARRKGINSRRDLAEKCATSHVWLGEVLNGKKPGYDLIDKISAVLDVSALWLRTGDPAVAPSWADRVHAIRDAAAELSEMDRLRLQIELGMVHADMEHAPDATANELLHLRAVQAAQCHRLAAAERTVQALLTELQDMRREIDLRAADPRRRLPRAAEHDDTYHIGDHARRAAIPTGPPPAKS